MKNFKMMATEPGSFNKKGSLFSSDVPSSSRRGRTGTHVSVMFDVALSIREYIQTNSPNWMLMKCTMRFPWSHILLKTKLKAYACFWRMNNV